jgi:uncharacterized protein
VKIRCPICKADVERPDDFEYRPFCSLRCKQIDLGNWLDAAYRISTPLSEDDLEEDDAELPVN